MTPSPTLPLGNNSPAGQVAAAPNSASAAPQPDTALFADYLNGIADDEAALGVPDSDDVVAESTDNHLSALDQQLAAVVPLDVAALLGLIPARAAPIEDSAGLGDVSGSRSGDGNDIAAALTATPPAPTFNSASTRAAASAADVLAGLDRALSIAAPQGTPIQPPTVTDAAAGNTAGTSGGKYPTIADELAALTASVADANRAVAETSQAVTKQAGSESVSAAAPPGLQTGDTALKLETFSNAGKNTLSPTAQATAGDSAAPANIVTTLGGPDGNGKARSPNSASVATHSNRQADIQPGDFRAAVINSSALEKRLLETTDTPAPAGARLPEASPYLTATGFYSGVVSQSTSATAGAGSVSLATPLDDPNWSRDLGHHLIHMAGSGQTRAEIRINPDDLGPIRITIEMSGKEANLSFAAAHSQTRDALENALPRLKEMFAGEGLGLGRASVNQDSHSAGGYQQPRQHLPFAPAFDTLPDRLGDLSSLPLNIAPTRRPGDHGGRVDLFA